MESGLQNIDAQLRAEVEALKATHDSTKADQIVALEQYDAQVRGELIKLHEGHAAIHDRLGQHADDHSAAMESGLQNVDAQLRAEINALKATHDESKIGQIRAPEQFDAQVQNELKTLHQHHAATLGRLGRHADDNGAALARLDLVVQERMAALASGHSSKHNAAMRDLQTLDQQLEQQMAALGDSHDDILAKALSEHRELTAEELRELVSTHDDHKSGINSRFNEYQDALRKELERFGNEHQSTRDELLAGLGDLKSEYQKLLARLAIDHTAQHTTSTGRRRRRRWGHCQRSGEWGTQA